MSPHKIPEPDGGFLKRDLARKLADTYGTPLFVYHRATLEANCRELRQQMAWNPGFREFFPVAALNHPALLRILHGAGCGVRCGNTVELRLAQMAHIPGPDILFVSCFPSYEDWQLALESGATLVLDHGQQLEWLSKKAYGDRVLGLRLGYSQKAGIPGRQQLDGYVKTGMSPEALLETARRAAARGYGKIGLHLSSGGTYGDWNTLRQVVQALLQFARRVQQETGLEVAWCDVGCGIPYRVRQPSYTSVAEVAAVLRNACGKVFPEPTAPPMPLYLGLEEHLAASAGVMLSRVRGIKAQNCVHVGLDTSFSDLPKLGPVSDKFPISKVSAPHAGQLVTYCFTGSTPMRSDVFSGRQPLPPLKAHDLVVISHTGSMCRSMSNNNYGNLRCPEVLLEESGPRLITRRETFEDYIRLLQGE